jgi:nitrogen regulatory protein P-II 1
MKEIKAFVRPDRLSDIVHHLHKEGFCCLTVFEGEGTGHYTDEREDFPSLRHTFSHAKTEKLEIVIPDRQVEKVLEIIHENGKTGYSGDGIVYITEVIDMLKVKTLEPDVENNDS